MLAARAMNNGRHLLVIGVNQAELASMLGGDGAVAPIYLMPDKGERLFSGPPIDQVVIVYRSTDAELAELMRGGGYVAHEIDIEHDADGTGRVVRERDGGPIS